MKNAHVLIICITVLLGIVVWRLTDHEKTSSIQAEPTPNINVVAIEHVLAEDARINENIANRIVQKMRSIDISQCPSDFQQAYVAHIGAWEEKSLAENEAIQWSKRYNSDNAKTEAFMRGLVNDFGIIGESNKERDRIRAMNQKAWQSINSTFTRVEQIAVGYGARLQSKKPENTQ